MFERGTDMSTKELLYSMIDSLTEQQMLELIDFMTDRKKQGISAASVMGSLANYADINLLPQEDKAWERAAKQNYENP